MMNTIRPLATIAILAGLGVFLAHQINDPADKQGEELTANWGEAPAYTAPPAESNSTAPPLGASPLGLPPAESAAPSAEPAAPSLPPLPSLPDNIGPPIATPSLDAPALPGQAPLATAPTGVPEIPMPDEVAEANYDGVPQPQPSTAPLSGGAPPLGPPVAADPYQAYAPPAAGAPSTPETSPMPPSTPLGEPGYTPLGQIPGPTGPTGASFRDALTAINQALERGELTRAHTMLSSWYGDPTLTPAEREKVKMLLNQLAGTVVYSTEHRLEPPYTVKPGDTLETIGNAYNVPWRLLAKINGVATPEAIQAGQTVKVLRGPFNAIVDAANNELVLMVDGKYAGKFPVQLSGAAQTPGAWKVTDKPVRYEPSAIPSGYAKTLVLKDASGAATLTIGAGGGSPMERGRVSVASADLEELHDILSVGSEMTIRK